MLHTTELIANMPGWKPRFSSRYLSLRGPACSSKAGPGAPRAGPTERNLEIVFTFVDLLPKRDGKRGGPP